MPYFALTYHVVADYVERRPAFRHLHLGHAGAATEHGILLLGGALADPVDQALIVFRCDSRDEVEEFARNDPYVVNGLVERWVVREWTVVIGTAHEGTK